MSRIGNWKSRDGTGGEPGNYAKKEIDFRGRGNRSQKKGDIEERRRNQRDEGDTSRTMGEIH